MIKKILEIARLVMCLGFGATFLIFTIIAAIFVSSSILYFVMPQLANFNNYEPAINAISAGLGAINIFLIFLSIFLTFSLLMRQFQKDNLTFMLSKPITTSQLLLGTSLGILFVILSFWLILSSEVLLIIAVFSKEHLSLAVFSLLPVSILVFLYLSLAVFFFCLWPSNLSAIFPFLFIITSILRVEIQNLLLESKIIWLRKIIDISFFFVPPVGQVLGISLKNLGMTSIKTDTISILLQSVFIITFFYLLSLRRIHKIICRQ
ncbi:MAG: hypothetical protein AB1472_07180 [Candidatus Omnitrophota bacterium]